MPKLGFNILLSLMVLKLKVSNSSILLLVQKEIVSPREYFSSTVKIGDATFFLECMYSFSSLLSYSKKSVKSLILNFVSDFQTSTCLVTRELILAGKIFCEVAEKPF